MKPGGKGGSHTISGLRFEERVDLITLLTKIPGYKTINSKERAGIDIYFIKILFQNCL